MTQSTKEFFVIGIGASAGGFPVIKQIIENLKEPTGAAIIIVQHLSADHKSFAQDLFGKVSNFTVKDIEDQDNIKPDHIYINPPDKLVKIDQDRFILEDTQKKVLNYPIDIFFSSLAINYKEKSIGLILSGNGTDGIRGGKIIKEAGGFVMVQEPETAAFDGMPRVALHAFTPDLILSPTEIPSAFYRIINNPYHINYSPEEHEDDIEEDLYDQVINIVSQYSGVDFFSYKSNSVIRRINKRIHVGHFQHVKEYHQYLLENPSEKKILFDDLLISVTNFFRDPEVYQYVAQYIIPELVKEQPKSLLRLWVPGCASGEEVYSLAILLEDFIESHQLNLTYKIFASDLNEAALKFASVGRYRNNIVVDVKNEWLNKYFVKHEDFYEVKKLIRKKIIFMQHNLLKDPPLMKLDMVMCRNLFIYLKQPAQSNILKNLHQALNSGGYLIIGPNESVGKKIDFFIEKSQEFRVYKNRKKIGQNDNGAGSPKKELSGGSFFFQNDQKASADNFFQQEVINKIAPSYLFINLRNEVLYNQGVLGNYLMVPQNMDKINIMKLSGTDLQVFLRNGIRKIRQDQENEVHFPNIQVRINDHPEMISLIFYAVRHEDILSQILIVFGKSIPGLSPESSHLPQDQDNKIKEVVKDQRLHELENELNVTREELRITLNEAEQTNEELQSSNEELMSANEELKSTNEELQSANEELYIVNTELQEKIDELTDLNNDLDNLLASIQIATIFLDENSYIRRITPNVKELFNIYDTDVERPVYHFTNHIGYDDIKLDIEWVKKQDEMLEKEFRHENGTYYLLRLLPYRTAEQKIAGVVMTFIDITQLKNIQESLRVSENNWKSLVENTPDVIARFDHNYRHVFVNEALEKEMGLSREQILGKTHRELNVTAETDTERFIKSLEQVFNTGKPLDFYNKAIVEGENYYFYIKLVPEINQETQKVETVLSITRDITALKKSELELAQSEHKWRSLVENTPDIIARFNQDLKHTFINPVVEALVGLPPQEFIGKDNQELGLIDNLDESNQAISKVFETAEETIFTIEFSRPQGKMYLESKLVPEFDQDGKVSTVLSITRDITPLKKYEQELLTKNKELNLINEYLDNFFYTVAHDLRSPITNQKLIMNLYESAKTEEEKHVILSKIKDTTETLENTLQGLIEIMENQQTDEKGAKATDINMPQLLNKILQELHRDIEKVQPRIETQFDQENICYIKPYIESIFRNLLSNAIKYRHDDHPLHIKITSSKEDDFVILKFTDNGIGLDLKKYKNNLFRPFKRFTKKADGKGVGLHIVRNMVIRNGGDIELKSEPDKGAEFTLYLQEYV
ncbi:MAG: CheR family methyltransferase [Candidatus Cyclobacteriaceae bacterium M3_2C_046]